MYLYVRKATSPIKNESPQRTFFVGPVLSLLLNLSVQNGGLLCIVNSSENPIILLIGPEQIIIVYV